MKSIFKITCIFFFLVLFGACKKDKTPLGVNVQPADDALNAAVIQMSVTGYSQKYDSIASINDRYKYLGINKDPYFGITDVGLYLNANIPDGKTFVSFGDDAHLTGAEIILTVYNLGESFVGNANAQLTYSVFPIISALNPGLVYYSGNDRSRSKTGPLMGAYTGSYTTFNSQLVLRIPVDVNFARSILNNPQYLADNVVFQNVYKGFYIQSSLNSDEGIIAKFDLEDAASGLYLYYQNGTPSAVKTDNVFKFTFGGTNPIRYNTVKHSFQTATSLLQQQILVPDTTIGRYNIFLKGMGVAKARIFIPDLTSVGDSFSVAVNRAELVFKLDPAYAIAGYTPPARLCLLPSDSIGREIFALDQINTTDAARYDGTYDSTNKQYLFNIARHVQAILSGKRKNHGFYLVVGDAQDLLTYTPIYNGTMKELFLMRSDNYVERVVLAGASQPDLKPVLNLSYIKLRHD